MMKRPFPLVLLTLTLLLVLSGCRNAADSPEQASEMLSAQPKWLIKEILVDDKVTFKDGKMAQQFSNVDFSRYMETIEIKKDGTFTGYFKGDKKPFTLKWLLDKDKIRVVSADPAGAKGGEWTIAPADVLANSFTMQTQSTAYNYPQMTKIQLRFKSTE